MREELGDVLWYVAALADRFGLDLDDIAAASLYKVADRWKPTPECNQAQYVRFTCAESAVLAVSVRRDDRGDGWSDETLATSGQPHGFGQVAVGIVFGHIADGAGGECLAREARIVGHRCDHDLGVGRFGAQSADQRQARPAGHTQIEYEHMGQISAKTWRSTLSTSLASATMANSRSAS